MAERRMFAKTIILSDAFLDMPCSARCLYFTLGMLADDDGFVNSPRAVMRQCGASDDDMKLLIAKKFVLIFDTGVIVIKHWRINNFLRNDRHQPTKYKEEFETLSVEKNGAYTLNPKPDAIPIELPEPQEDDDFPPESESAREKRKKAYAESDLPYSFSYKMRLAFAGRPCPICKYKMENFEGGPHRPTIQHNVPISKGGAHELSNISVICHSCNTSIQDKETGPLNNAEVVEEWGKILGIPSIGIPRIDKDSIGKDRLGKDSVGEVKGSAPTPGTPVALNPPTPVDINDYLVQQGLPRIDAVKFVSIYQAKGWKLAGGVPMMDWHPKAEQWAREDALKNPNGYTPPDPNDRYNFNSIDMDTLIDRI